MVEPSAGTNQPVFEKFSTASVRNWPKDVPMPGVIEPVVNVGHHRSIKKSPAVRFPERVNIIGPAKLPLLPLEKLATTRSSGEPPTKLVGVGEVKTLSVVLATS